MTHHDRRNPHGRPETALDEVLHEVPHEAEEEPRHD